MVASEVRPGGAVIAPLNITNPVPQFDIADFQFGLMSRKELDRDDEPPRIFRREADKKPQDGAQKPLATSLKPRRQQSVSLETNGILQEAPQMALSRPCRHHSISSRAHSPGTGST